MQLTQQGSNLPVTLSRETLNTLPQMFSLTQLPSVELPGRRDIFKPPWRKKKISPSQVRPAEKLPMLSTIVWSQTNPMAVIDDQILAAGEKDSTSQFKVETINRKSVQIRYIRNQKVVVLTLKDNG